LTDWTIQNDRQSVTVGINTRLSQLRKQGLVPALIRLGKDHTRLFLREHGLSFIPNRKPRALVSDHLVWDPVTNRLCYTSRMIPIRFNDLLLHGIAVEGTSPANSPR
jgi:hypothetical protein